jgi:hypothetical protein
MRASCPSVSPELTVEISMPTTLAVPTAYPAFRHPPSGGIKGSICLLIKEL